MKTADAARNRWVGLLIHFGIAEHFLKNRHGPCPCCGGKDRFRFDNKDGNGTFYCSQCGPGDGFELLKRFTGLPFKELARQIDTLIDNLPIDIAPIKAAGAGDPIQRLSRIGRSLKPIGDINPVRTYLNARGLIDLPLAYLRYCPSAKYFDNRQCIGTYPAMVALYSDAHGGIESMHLTYLTPNGEKAPVPNVRKSLPPINGLRGCAIRLSEVQAHIGLAEGIETAIAVSNQFGLPCWASGNAGLMETFKAPAAVRRVSIFADNDANHAGQKAAHTLAHRLARDGLSVDVHIPGTVGEDYADVYRAGAHCH